jgi:hypothetical protein
MGAALSFSPREERPLLRGEGWGEGLPPRTELAQTPPHPLRI